MSTWKWAAASCRGSSHARSKTRKQDALSCSARAGTLLAIVSDGAGSASFGGEGASIVCRTLSSLARSAISSGELPSDDQIWSWIDASRDRISAAATANGVERREFAATLVCLLSTGTSSIVMHIGDGAAVIQGADNVWSAASWPEQGEYASTTFFVTDDPQPKLRITRLDSPIRAAAVFTDGIERLALDFSTHKPFQPFFNSMIRPVIDAEVSGRNERLSAGLRQFLNSPRVLERTDDDTTLILAGRA